jgi:hypothetical protein
VSLCSLRGSCFACAATLHLSAMNTCARRGDHMDASRAAIIGENVRSPNRTVRTRAPQKFARLRNSDGKPRARLEGDTGEESSETPTRTSLVSNARTGGSPLAESACPILATLALRSIRLSAVGSQRSVGERCNTCSIGSRLRRQIASRWPGTRPLMNSLAPRGETAYKGACLATRNSRIL